jgi:predicted GNAT family acetyltransferase
MPQVEITHHAGPNGGEYRARVEGSDHVGRLTYWKRGDDVRVVDQTLVPPPIGGQGIAARLVEALIADARSENFRVVPQCSYVDAAFRRHKEWSALRA